MIVKWKKKCVFVLVIVVVAYTIMCVTVAG
jgi:hypothetical protein